MRGVKYFMLLSLFTVFFTGCAIANENGNPKRQVAKILTNAQCSDCKQRIEGVLNYEKGINYAVLDVETKMVEVRFNSKRTSLEKIRKTISEIGYDADDVKANPKTQEELPGCCQPGGHD